MSASNDPLITVQELAAELRLAPSTLFSWRHIGTGPRSMKLGKKRVVYRRSEVDAWLAEQERASVRVAS